MDLTRASWYRDAALLPDPLAPAQAAFDQTIEDLRKRSAKDPRKQEQLQRICGAQSTSLADVLAAVASAQEHYSRKHAGSKASAAIAAFSQRIVHYGKVMDVLVSHHPEYVALVWGTFKLLFGAVVEHEHIGATIVTGLCSIGNALSRVQLVTCLYPTPMMKQLVAKLYASILKFLMRALGWYEEGKLTRALHSITRPVALHYNDILEEIRRATQSITDLAATSSQAEQRDMHEELRIVQRDVHLTLQLSQASQETIDRQLELLSDALQQLRVTVSLNRSLETTQPIVSSPTAPDIDLPHALALIASGSLVDHRESYRRALVLRDRRSRIHLRHQQQPWQSSKMLSWNRAPHSALICFRSTFRDRHILEDFGVSIIEHLRRSKVSVLWALRGTIPVVSATVMLKSLIQQALGLYQNQCRDKVFTNQLYSFLDAGSVRDYVCLLAEILQYFQLIYIIVDTETLDLPANEDFGSYIQLLTQLLVDRQSRSVVKTLTISRGPPRSASTPSSDATVRLPKAPRRKRREISLEPTQLPNRAPRTRWAPR